MQTQFDNKLLSSFLLHIDHILLDQGNAYENTSSSLFPIKHKIYGKYAYATPYRQLVDDVSITGANILSGVTINGSFIGPGTSGLSSIDQKNGIVFFDSPQSETISGSYAIKNLSIHSTNKPEAALIFETKYYHKNEISQSLSGLKMSDQTIPAIFNKVSSSENEPFCFGMDNNNVKIKSIILADSQYLQDGTCNILKNRARQYIAIIDPEDLPYNQFGHYTGVNYNYDTLSSNAQKCLIWKAKVSDLSATQGLNDLNPSIFPALVDYEIWGNVS